jgi:hypothetical protein
LKLGSPTSMNSPSTVARIRPSIIVS